MAQATRGAHSAATTNARWPKTFTGSCGSISIQGRIILAGHDIGLMVAYAYAQAHRDEVSHLMVMDAPLPGTTVFDRLRADPRVWHFAFHGARDIPEMLVAGRERQYLQAF